MKNPPKKPPPNQNKGEKREMIGKYARYLVPVGWRALKASEPIRKGDKSRTGDGWRVVWEMECGSPMQECHHGLVIRKLIPKPTRRARG